METLGAFWDGESPPRAQLPVARPSGRLRCGAATLHGRQPLPPLLGARATFGGLHTAPTLRAVQLTAPPDSPGAARQPLAESKPRRRVPGSRAEAAPPPHDPEPVFWEIALVWSLSKNDSQRARKRKQAEAAAAGAPAAEPDSDEEEMLRSPTWKDVREALLGAGLSVRMLRSKDADDFFMAVGGTLSALQAEAERCGFELRLRAKESGALADRPMPFFAYQRAQDAHYERFEEARAGGAKRGARAAADAELGGATAARGPPFASIERQRLMEGAINRALLQRCDLNLTQLRNLSNACHDFLYLHAEDERQLVEECLGSHSSGCRLPAPSDLRAYKLGALEPARRYLGEQVCFYFAFLRFYTRALLPPSIIGTATYVVYWLREDLYLLLVPAFCLLLMLWSAVFVELWQARERTLRHVWGMEAFAEQEGERLGFRGKLDQGIYTPAGDWVTVRDADLAMMGYRLPAPKAVHTSRRARMRRQACSFGVLLCMGFLCILSTLGIFAFRAYIASLSIGPYLAGALNAVAITLLNTAFREAALKLNEWENHRRASSFTGALVYKMFIFQFINCYFSLFFIAFVKPYGATFLFVEPTECRGALRSGDESLTPAQHCYDELQTQLMMILATNLLVGNLIERVNSEVGAVSARLTEAVQGWMAARSRGRSSRPKGRDKARQAKRKPGDAAAALDGGLQSAAAGAERLSSPQRAILDDLARAAPRRAAGETERRLAGRPPACALEPAAAAGARRPQGLPSRASRTYPSGGPPASGAPAELAPAAPEPRGAREVDPEYLSLMEQVDEQDDMPVLLAEAHGLGPTFYEYNEMALQFGYICMFSVSFPPAALLALGNNVVEFTADAHKLLRGHRRVKYEGAVGIKPWGNIFRFLEVVGILTNTLIFLLLSTELRALPVYVIVLLVLCVFFGVLILKLVISFLLPDVPASLRKAMAKEKWTTKELQGVLDKAEHAQLATPARKSDGGRTPSKLREAR